MMGRIRSIKPEILEDERSAGLSCAAWRLWVSLWLLADDFGNLRGHPRRLAAEVFWAQDHPPEVAELLDELAAAGLIEHYTVRGQQYLHLQNWEKHQRIDNAGKPRVPGPSEADPHEATASPAHSTTVENVRPLDVPKPEPSTPPRAMTRASPIMREAPGDPAALPPPAIRERAQSGEPSRIDVVALVQTYAQRAQDVASARAFEASRHPAAGLREPPQASATRGSDPDLDPDPDPDPDLNPPAPAAPAPIAGNPTERGRPMQRSSLPPRATPARPRPVARAAPRGAETEPITLGVPEPSRRQGAAQSDVRAVAEAYQRRWVETRRPDDGRPPRLTQADVAQARAIVREHGRDQTLVFLERFLDDPDPWLTRQGHPLRLLPSRLLGYRATTGPRPPSKFEEPIPAFAVTREVRL